MSMSILKSALLVVILSSATAGLAFARDQPAAHYTDERDERYARDDRNHVDPDQVLHDRVHDALETELGRAGQGIVVTVRRGVVTLKGEVDSERIRQDAHAITHDMDGVRSVKFSRLVARRYASRDDD